MSSSFHLPEPCTHENCGSRRFHQGDDGYTYCDRGHQQSERGTCVSQDTGELLQTGRKARRQDSDATSNTSRATGLSGSRAFGHYLLCVQLVLRKQLRWLMETKKLPEELEALVCDLWALRLQKLQSGVGYDSETETETLYFSSQSEGETSATSASTRSRQGRGRSAAKLDGNTPNLLDTVTLCYIGTLLLREPITVADLYRWVRKGEILYYRAAKNLPLGMRERLPPTYQELLEPQPLGSPERLQQNVLTTLTRLGEEHGMAFPPINHPLVLYSRVRELALPVEVFTATTRLASLLKMDFTWNVGRKAREKDVVLRYPDARLMALLVVATKLLFPPNVLKRYQTSATDMSALSLDWNAWAELHSLKPAEDGEQRKLGYDEAMRFLQTDVLEVAGDRLDEYMNWFERNIATKDNQDWGQAGIESDFRRALFAMVRTPDDNRSAPTDTQVSPTDHAETVQKRLRQAHTLLTPKRIIEAFPAVEDSVHRTGTFYRRFRSVEDLNGPVKVLYERAAELAGLSCKGVVRAVFLLERKVQKFEEELRKGKET